MYNRTHYVSEFQSLKSNPDNVTFHSLGGLCHNGGNTGVENLAVDTGGAIYDICTVVDSASASSFWTDFATEILTFESNGIFGIESRSSISNGFYCHSKWTSTKRWMDIRERYK